MTNFQVGILTLIALALIGSTAYYLFKPSIGLDRKLAKGGGRTIAIVIIAVLAVPLATASVLSIMGKSGGMFVGKGDETGNPNIVWSILYHSMDPGNQHMAQDGWPKIVVFFIALFGVVFMNGVTISSIVNWFGRRVDKWEKGLVRYPKSLKRNNFVVIIGDKALVPDLIRQIFQRKEKIDYVVILTNGDVESYRKRLVSFLQPTDEARVILYFGEQTSGDDIEDLYLQYAKEVFILGNEVGEENEKTEHDALNMRCLQIISEKLHGSVPKEHRLICRVMFEFQTSFSIYQFADISSQISSYMDFRPFNYYGLWAQRVFVNRKLSFSSEERSGYLPLEGELPIMPDSKDFVHLVVVGMSKMGVSMAIEAAHLAHYPNFNADSNLKTRITFIDAECDTDMRYFKGRFKGLFALSRWCYKDSCADKNLYNTSAWENPWDMELNQHLGSDFIDVEWEFIKGGIESDEIHSYLSEAASNPRARFTLAICLPQDNQNVAAALYLPDEVYEKAVQVLVYQRHSDSIINSISCNNKINLYYRLLKPFGMLANAYDDNMYETTQRIAGVLGEKYYEMYKNVNLENDVKESCRVNVRGKSMAAKEWSNVYNANSIWGKLRSVGYCRKPVMTEEDIEQLARTEHSRWVMEQLLMRFRALTVKEQSGVLDGTLDKDVLKGDKMAHLDICSYDRLQKVDPVVCRYDEGFIRIIPEILEVLVRECNSLDCNNSKK